MKFIPEQSFSEILREASADLTHMPLVEYFTKKLHNKGLDFISLWNAGEIKIIESALEPGQWSSFEQLLLRFEKLAKENISKSQQQFEQENIEFSKEIEFLRTDKEILDTAEALRKKQIHTNYVRPFNPNFLSGDQLSLLYAAKAALAPSHKKKSDQNRANRIGKKSKLVTKKELETYRDEFKAKKKNKSDHGWKKPACIDFDMDVKTLNRIMNGGITALFPVKRKT